MNTILIASDLDRTIVPNGKEPESPKARPRLRVLADHPNVELVYVSGRNIDLLQEAMIEYNLPVPAYAIGDVGTTVYRVGKEHAWQPMEAWQHVIAEDWRGKKWADVKALFDDVSEMWLQDNVEISQNDFKVSYNTDPNVDRDALLAELRARTETADIDASLVWSVDEAKGIGLLDVLPKSATKLHAIQWLRDFLGFEEEQVVFAGDSGNDMPALTSGLQAVLVNNARQEVKDEAVALVQQKGVEDMLYVAKGDFLGMNGNYSAGVLEGVARFFPETKDIYGNS